MPRLTAVAIAIMALALSGCGHTVPERTLSGAGIGAAVGGVTGAVTRPSQVNLGKPIWRQ
jgi:hypothetical protein